MVWYGAGAVRGLLPTVAAKKRTWLICAAVIPVGSELPPDPRLSFDLLIQHALYVVPYSLADTLPRSEVLKKP